MMSVNEIIESSEIVELAPGVIMYKNIFSPENIIELIESESKEDWPYLMWENSETDNGKISSYRMSVQMELNPLQANKIENIPRMKPAAVLWKKIFKNIDAAVYHYRDKYSLELSTDEGYRVLKYPSGGEYSSHCDYGSENGRILSCVGWFNDDFNGGELEFDYFGIKVSPSAGSMVLFPSNYLYRHTAHPVEENNFGIKYAFVTWLR